MFEFQLDKNDVYNYELKVEFLNSLDKEYCVVDSITVFKKIKEFESKKKKDIAFFSRELAKEVLSNISAKSQQANYRYLAAIKRYSDWVCEKANKKNIWNTILMDDVQLDSTFENRMVKDPAMLQDLLDTVYEGINSSPSMDWFYRIIFYLLYMGIKKEYIPHIKTTDINLIKRTINCEGNEFYIDKNILPYIEEAIDLKEVCILTRSKGVSVKALVDSPYLIKKSISGALGREKSEIVDMQWMMWKFSKFNTKYQEETGKKVSYTSERIYDSGNFYRLLQEERKNKEIDFDIMSMLYPELAPTNVYSKLKEYKTWKKTFYQKESALL